MCRGQKQKMQIRQKMQPGYLQGAWWSDTPLGVWWFFLTRATRIFRKFPRDFNWLKFGEVSTGEISHEFNWLYFVRHVARIKFAQNSCCTSSKSITTHRETCYIFLHVYKLCFCPCCTSLRMYNTQFLLLLHVAATCPYNMFPRIKMQSIFRVYCGNAG